MKDNPVLSSISSHFKNNLPFVVYALPGEITLTGLFQQNDKLFEINDWQESGFAMATFNQDLPVSYIPISQSECLKAKIETKPSLNTFFELKQSDSDRDDHIARIKNAIHLINTSELEKVVLSRRQEIQMNEFRIPDLIRSLFSEYPSAFRYLWFHPKTGLWCGATPELLLSIDDISFETMSLAGTRVIHPEGTQDWTQKEYREQQLVTDTILENLRPFTRSLKATDTYTVKAANLEHLRTDISGSFTDRNDIASLLAVLHPTPAVCGKPRMKAMDLIGSIEGYERSYYTGYVGPVGDENRLTRLFVNLRCMSVEGKRATVYTGGGITAQSDPEAEWVETCNKQHTMAKLLRQFL